MAIVPSFAAASLELGEKWVAHMKPMKTADLLKLSKRQSFVKPNG